VLVLVLASVLGFESGPKASRTSTSTRTRTKRPMSSLETAQIWSSFFSAQTGRSHPEATLLWNYISKAGIDCILGYVAIVGWVEPTPGFVGFRCTLPNLHFSGVIMKCETQQRPILDNE